MCTLTVLSLADKTLVTMTRDEAIDRAPEQPPKLWSAQALLAPVDGAAGGTWIGVNASGQWACLLNGYVALTGNKPAFQTRGGIIPHILSQAKPLAALKALDLSPYDSFRLWLGAANTPVQELFWNGQTPQWQTIDASQAFVSSSSLDQDKVKAYRQQAFEAWVTGGAALLPNGLPVIHCQSEKGFESYSVNMRRDYACSKSITQILLSNQVPKMRYWLNPFFEQNPAEIEFKI